MSYVRRTHSELTYAVDWRCHRCGASGTVEIPTSQGCDKLFAQVLDAHENAVEVRACVYATKDGCYCDHRYLAITPPPGKDGDPR